MGTQLDEVRRNLLLETVEITLYGVTHKMCRTPAGKGLASYMRLRNRMRVQIWSKLKNIPAQLSDGTPEELDANKIEIIDALKHNSDVTNNALCESQEDDATDILSAIYWSIARANPSVELAAISLALDETNIAEALTQLIEVNRDKLPQDPKATTPTTAGSGMENSTPTTGESA